MTKQLAFDLYRPDFDGTTYDPDRDKKRLTGQLMRVFDVLADGGWHTLDDICAQASPCMPQSASARIRDLRKHQFGGHSVERRNLGGGLWEYRLLTGPSNED